MMFHSNTLPPVRKRPRPEGFDVQHHQEVKFATVTLFIVERRMGCSRRSFLTSLARSKGFSVDDVLSTKVTHVISEGNQASELWTWLRAQTAPPVADTEVLDISWFTESMRAGGPVVVESRHRIQDPSSQFRVGLPSTSESTVSQYACQRRTTLDNPNKIFTDAFEVLAENSDFCDSKGQALAYKRAASVLKSLPAALRCLGDTEGLPCLGEQTRAVVEDIFECGRSSKVETILSDEKFQTMKLFTSVFGVGPKTAEKWYLRGLRTLEEIVSEPHVHLNRMQQAGFLYYADITRPVSKAEAHAVGRIVKETVQEMSPNASVVLTGGFRRGKEFGHDVDYILTTPEMGTEEGLLLRVIDRLNYQGILLYTEYQGSTFDANRLPCRRFEAMDHFPKCFLIIQLHAAAIQDGTLSCDPGDRRGWRAVRLDLVAPPADRFAFALLGWSGSTQFERDLRRFARLERGMLLDNHALYDKSKDAFLPAKTEEDIFGHLGLEYIEPWQRNA
ncbi:LOW QUALITY PROTEIN: DNA nucleotidylexotransferase [Clupea harengus]|uniref:DNA-directed DNA/RNA polymerase mu n=1 Tax=Clupea harengus TaxID=7950 RepID=A0A8M1KNU2_CLUHA|nr:LOW QUALITY PROTEIN: DNA nucleotidylexotransferase [Clupea harengus]